MVLINEVSKKANLTKKAIEYYTEHELIYPAILENGYRDFNQNDVERLTKISLFRKLGLSVEEIKTVLADETGESLQKIAIHKELRAQREQANRTVLNKLCRGQNCSEIIADLEAIDLKTTIAEKLLEAFPGYYGRFICLHFSRFLTKPIATEEERQAYDEITVFLDNAPSLDFPAVVQNFLDENTRDYNLDFVSNLLENVKHSIENPEAFFLENKEVLERYLHFRQSDEYKNSPLNIIQDLLKEFFTSSGYYDVFLPAMKRLSKSYAEYSHQMEVANEMFLSQYPEFQ
ncbi:MAG: MerR family transcriptional regulator [Firmicutes bacterium]|nr:MerR family transcriptional regulator [Bacillota bacterium]